MHAGEEELPTSVKILLDLAVAIQKEKSQEQENQHDPASMPLPPADPQGGMQPIQAAEAEAVGQGVIAVEEEARV